MQKLVNRSQLSAPQAKYSPPSPPLASGNPVNVASVASVVELVLARMHARYVTMSVPPSHPVKP